jgi:hypothetical protein
MNTLAASPAKIIIFHPQQVFFEYFSRNFFFMNTLAAHVTRNRMIPNHLQAHCPQGGMGGVEYRLKV